MSLQSQEINRVTAKLTTRDNIVSEFTSAEVTCNLDDLTTALKEIRQILNSALTVLVNNDNNVNDDETKDEGSLEEEYEEEDAKVLDAIFKKRKKAASKQEKREVKLKL